MKIKEEKQNGFEKYKLEVAESVSAVQRRIRGEKENREYVNFNDYPAEELKKEVVTAIKEVLGVQEIEEVGLLVPPTHIAGDFALEIFGLAKKLKEKPDILAKKIARGAPLALNLRLRYL